MKADLPDVPPLLGWRPGLRVLVDNLLTNAVVHGGPDVPVTLRLEARDDRVRLVVEDGGPGFPPGDRTRLLRRFERGAATSPGTGLGLALVAQQVTLHHGTVDLGDADPAGARVVVELPLAVGSA